jgi:hypothetical protein
MERLVVSKSGLYFRWEQSHNAAHDQITLLSFSQKGLSLETLLCYLVTSAAPLGHPDSLMQNWDSWPSETIDRKNPL